HVSMKGLHALILFLDHLPKLQQSHRVPLADSVPMILVDAKKLQHEHDRIVFLDSITAAPLVDGALKFRVIIRRLHGWPFRLRPRRATVAAALNRVARRTGAAT